MKKILVPIDGSDCSNKAIDMARELALLYRSRLVLLHVGTDFHYQFYPISPFGADGVPFPQEFIDKIERVAHEILEAGLARCVDLGDKVETVFLEGKPAEVIIDYVDTHDIDMVVIGSHGTSGFKRFLMGNVANKVALSIEKPILILK